MQCSHHAVCVCAYLLRIQHGGDLCIWLVAVSDTPAQEFWCLSGHNDDRGVSPKSDASDSLSALPIGFELHA